MRKINRVLSAIPLALLFVVFQMMHNDDSRHDVDLDLSLDKSGALDGFAFTPVVFDGA